MIQKNLSGINSPVRKIKGKVELHGSTEPITYSYTDALKSFTVERVGEGKFFGYGICQKANIKLIDVERKIYPATSDYFKIHITANNEYISPYPKLHVTENHRDEKTNELSVTAYDALYWLSAHLVGELGLEAPYTLREVAEACAGFLGGQLVIINIEDGSFDLLYEEGANLEGTENIREILNAIAEATQSIYYLDADDNLVFKRLDRDGEAVLNITRDDYIELKTRDGRRLQTITHATELGDNISSSIAAIGSTQYIRDNPFWELREDISELVERAVAAICGISINQFECSWRGNYLLEIGDKITLTTKDNKTEISYALDETLEYNGFLSSKIQWAYAENEAESPANPTSLGETLKLTYAKVDKANKQIDIVVSDLNEVSQITMNTTNIVSSVSNEMENISQKVEQTITRDEVNIQITEALKDGITEVTTTTGFTFNDEGLTVTKSGAEMKTQITEDGMAVYRSNKEVLTADNTGVKAENLHATTYLIIGKNSRLEDYNSNRTGCFWIGG